MALLLIFLNRLWSLSRLSVSSLGSMALLLNRWVYSVSDCACLSVSSLGSIPLLPHHQTRATGAEETFSILPRIDSSVTCGSWIKIDQCYRLSVSSLGSMPLLPKQQTRSNGKFALSVSSLDHSQLSMQMIYLRCWLFQYPPSDRFLCYATMAYLTINAASFSILPRIDSSVTHPSAYLTINAVLSVSSLGSIPLLPNEVFQSRYFLSVSSLGSMPLLPQPFKTKVAKNFQILPRIDASVTVNIEQASCWSRFQYPPSDRCLSNYISNTAKVMCRFFQYLPSDRCLSNHSISSRPGIKTFSILPRIDASLTSIHPTTQTDRWLCYRDCIPKCGKVSNFQYPRSDRWLCYRDCIPKCGKVSNFQYPRSDRWLCYSRRSTARSRHRSLSVSSLGSMALLLNLWRCSKNRKWSFSILPRIDGSVTASDERRQLHDVAFSVSSLGSMALLPTIQTFAPIPYSKLSVSSLGSMALLLI